MICRPATRWPSRPSPGTAGSRAGAQIYRPSRNCSDLEYQQRVESNVQSQLLGKFNRDADARRLPTPLPGIATAPGSDPRAGEPAAANVAIEGDMHPMWIDERLLLVRRVKLGDRTWLQGCWLDWEALHAWLGQRVSDLLLEAELTPAVFPITEGDRRTPYLLASLPVRLVPRRVVAADESLSSAIRTSLIVAWLCTALAVVAVVVLVLGMSALSERRAAFASAVTHELRTPLTTFRIYTEMLAADMVPDEASRREYLETLRGESERLAQLIENVLAYSRLEGRRAVTHSEDVTIGQLFDRFACRLRRRANQDKMVLDLTIDEAPGNETVRTDVSAFEQIVANLVDNACKYGVRATDRRIHLAVEVDARWLRVRVTDHGPGIAADVARRLFRPFSRSAQEAANSAPGVGLGLALSRRLARRLGGTLILLPSHTAGACFELKLPKIWGQVLTFNFCSRP